MKKIPPQFTLWFLMFVTLLALSYAIAVTRKYLTLQTLVQTQPQMSSVTDQMFSGEYAITGDTYFGSKPYALVYQYDNSTNEFSPTTGQFVLKSPDESFYPSVVLRQERYYPYEVDRVVLSQSHSKLILQSHAGDATQHILMELDTDIPQLLNFEVLDVGDTYFRNTWVLSWLDDLTVLFRTDDYNPDTNKTTVTYWTAPYNNVSQRTTISIAK